MLSKPVQSCKFIDMEEKRVSRKRTIDLISLDGTAIGSPADLLNGPGGARNVDGGAKAHSNELVGEGSLRLQKHKAMKLPNDVDNSSTQNQHMCQSCSSIDFSKILPGPRAWKRTALRLGTLSQFTVDPECLLCQLFASMASLAYAPSNSHSQSVDDVTFYLCSFYTAAMYGHDWRNSRTVKKSPTSISYAIIDEQVLHDPEDSFTRERKISHDLWPSRTSIQRSGWLSPALMPGDQSKFAATTIKFGAEFDMVKSWLKFCCQNHGENCEPLDIRAIPALQVVDCETGLVVPAVRSCKYLALSYVWGRAPFTELVDAKDFNLLVESTPILIRDAITATKRLGHQYLWIDRYCIPQQEGEERHSQIQQMDLIYSKALATIIAIASPDPSHGLPGVGSRTRDRSVMVNLGNELHAYVPPHPGREITSSIWNTRGWTHQETILSRRRIFFCRNQVYFECAGMHCHDTMNFPLETLHRPDLRIFSNWNRPRLFSRVRQTKDPLTSIFDHIHTYTKRYLTRPEDILNGIMGTFHAFESMHDSFRHYWGIPMVPDVAYCSNLDRAPRKSTRTEEFLTSLCWNLSEPGPRRVGFPSWSWAGWHGTLKPQAEDAGYIDNKYCVKVWIDSIFQSQMDLGTFCDTSGEIDVFPREPTPYIRIEAAFFQVRFRLSTRKESKWQAIIETGKERLIYTTFFITRHTFVGDELHNRLLEESWSAFLLGDRMKTKSDTSTKRRLLSNENPSAMICVVDSSDIEKDIIERIGMMEIDNPEEMAELDEIPKHRCFRKYG